MKVEPPRALEVIVVKIVIPVYVQVIDPQFPTDSFVEHVFGENTSAHTRMGDVVIGIEVSKVYGWPDPTARFHTLLGHGG